MPPRRPLIAGNWKMYKTNPEAVQAAEAIKSLTADEHRVDIMIAPPCTALSAVAAVIQDTPIALGAQNVHWETEGAYTGEVSAPMISTVGCSHAIIGHSERRQYFGETDNSVNRKIRAALKADLVPVMCIGENESQREQGLTFSILDKQVQNGLKDLASEDLANLVLAYEPVWAIGTGKTATTQQAQEVHAHLRGLMEKVFGEPFAQGLRILYGGSVKPQNIKGLMAMADVDGALVGGASLDPALFSQLVHYLD